MNYRRAVGPYTRSYVAVAIAAAVVLILGAAVSWWLPAGLAVLAIIVILKRRGRALAVALAVAVGLFVLGTAVSWWLVLGLAMFGVIATSPKLAEASLKLVCAAVVAMLAVVAFNVALGIAFEAAPDSWEKPTHRLPIAVGLGLALVVFAWIAYYYLRGTWLHPDADAAPADRNTRVAAPLWTRGPAAVGALALACAVILGLPPLVAWIQARHQPAPTALPAALDSRLDVIMVSDRVRTDLPGGTAAAPADVNVQYAVGQAIGEHVLWVHTAIADAEQARAALGIPGSEDVTAPVLRDRAGAAIVLLVPPASDCTGELTRWREIAAKAQSDLHATVPVVALLSAGGAGAEACWKQSKIVAGVEEVGTRLVTDAAVSAATAAASTRPYADVAFAYRPVLLFDTGERVPRPLSIEWMFQNRWIQQCADLDSSGKCDTTPVEQPEKLRSPGMHLVIAHDQPDFRKLARAERDAWKLGEQGPGSEQPLGFGSRIYVNPLLVADALYLDYWWYLRDNPAGSGKRAFCGAGLVILGVTCFDHESDWEGVTVVLKRSGHGWTPQAVQYAQHESVVRYGWPQLRNYWKDRLAKQLSDVPGHTTRPIVFVASGTHASYPHPCDHGCRQVPANLEEGDHDGELLWVGDDDAICAAVTCLAPLPTATGGRGPASWNAFAGPWGRRHCFLKYYCDSGTPPPAPGQQDRYKDPAHFDGTADVTARNGGYVAAPR